MAEMKMKEAEESNERRRAVVRKSKDSRQRQQRQSSSGSGQSSAGICLDPAEASLVSQLPLNSRVSQLRRDDTPRRCKPQKVRKKSETKAK